jgi:hypothetical protein
VTNDELYNQLAYYTLSHPDSSFLHQHAVDAYAAQCASENSGTIQNRFRLSSPTPVLHPAKTCNS